MAEIVGFVLAVTVTASLLAIVGFGLYVISLMLWTARHGAKNRLAQDLDRVLLEILGPRKPVKFPELTARKLRRPRQRSE